jgi:hypothetical protein
MGCTGGHGPNHRMRSPHCHTCLVPRRNTAHARTRYAASVYAYAGFLWVSLSLSCAHTHSGGVGHVSGTTKLTRRPRGAMMAAMGLRPRKARAPAWSALSTVASAAASDARSVTEPDGWRNSGATAAADTLTFARTLPFTCTRPTPKSALCSPRDTQKTPACIACWLRLRRGRKPLPGW